MQNKQLKWTDKEWSVLLECKIDEVSYWRNWLAENYEMRVYCENEHWFFAIYRVTDSLALPIACAKGFSKKSKLQKYVNECFIPHIVCYDAQNPRPNKIFQMLHIRNIQQIKEI